ncbi:hypothetical protein HWV62_19419 [Athelia sp. TMB]|nr:hypothetical protein HWV62_19419 [Athelia sp. TMB]
MAQIFTKKLTFTCNDLGNEATLLFTFDQPPTGVDPAEGHYEGNITYKNQFAFIIPQNDEDEIISASTYVDINVRALFPMLVPQILIVFSLCSPGKVPR